MTNVMKSILIKKPGNASSLELVVDANIPQPKRGQVRVKMVTAGVSLPDVTICAGTYPAGQPSFPLTPGYDGVGRIDAIGSGVTTFAVGDWVAISSKIGCWSEYACFPAQQTLEAVVAKIREDIDPAHACALVLNYITAYQMLTRSASLKPGSRVLIHGMSGGVGTALVELSVHLGLEVYGTCSTRKMERMRQLGPKVTPIDYTTSDFVQEIRALPAPAGVDAVFDAIGGSNFTRSYKCLRRGGTFVAYGVQSAMNSGLAGLVSAYLPFMRIQMWRPFSHLAGATMYKVNHLRMDHKDWFQEDLAHLAELVNSGAIRPTIHEPKYNLDNITEAFELVEKNSVIGKVILAFP